MANLRQVHAGSAQKSAVIFVHGLGGHPIDTWRHAECKADDCWPHWVGKDGECDTWVLGYDADLSAWRDQAMPLPDQGDQVLDLLDAQPRLGGRQLVLVGHSLGGLVIKTLIVSGLSKGVPRFEALVGRIRAVVFIATPHAGSQLASLARAARCVLRTNVQVGNMTAHDPHLRDINQRFRHAVSQQGLAAHVFAETRGVRIGPRVFGLHIGPRVMVVNQTSVDPGLAGVPPVGMAGDHFSICKPADRGQHIHLSLCKFIARVQDAAEARAAATPSTASPAAAPAVGLLSVPPPPYEAGRLSGAQDNRLQPREGRLYGRAAEVEQVLGYLRSSRSAAVVSAQVAGVGGIGKTEVCKAALKAWLAESPDAAAYYVDVPDRGGAAELVYRVGRALGVDAIDSLGQLLAIMPAGLYYLDNLESVAEQTEGQDVLRALAAQGGVRLLASSRVSLPTVLGKPILIDALPEEEALRLFRDLWTGQDALPADAALHRFVVEQLGAHALSVTLAARLGDCYSYADLVQRWVAVGALMAQDPEDRSRLGSLPASLRLTADALAHREGALALWTVAALFAGGVPSQLLAQLEAAGGWHEGRPVLVRHHLLARRGERWHMLPPVARFALDASARTEAGFDWLACRGAVHAVFATAVNAGNSIASTAESLVARQWILENFGALARLVLQELASADPDHHWIQATHDKLINQYQFRIAQSRELLRSLIDQLERPASALLALGDLEGRLGRPDEARGLYDRALALYEKEQDGLGQANTLLALGALEGRLGRPDEARGLYDRALALYEKEQDGLGQANTLLALGDLERRLGRPDEARGLYDRALALYEKEQAGLGQANTLLALGALEGRLGRPDEAQGLYDRALALYEKEQNGLGQANTLQAVGDMLREGGRFADAAKVYQKALDLYAHEQEPVGTAFTFAGLARCLHALREEQGRDTAMVNALAAAEGAHVESVKRHVGGVLVEITGGRDAAQAWIDRHSAAN